MIAGMAAQPRQTILVTGVRSEKRPHMMAAVVAALQSERHDIVTDMTDISGRGKLENINLILARHDLDQFDWVIMTDDDIVLPPQFVDIFLAVCALCGFKLAMPAHRFNSFSGYDVTRRGWGTVARQTKFVEVGPLTAFNRVTFDAVFPLPVLRYGWGVDLHWPLLADQRGWPMGVVDAVPVQHFSRIGGSYSRAAATDEACEYLAKRGHLSRRDTFQVIRRVPPDQTRRHHSISITALM